MRALMLVASDDLMLIVDVRSAASATSAVLLDVW